MDKIGIYAYLTNQNIKFEAIEHDAVYSMDELGSCEFPHKEYDAKNLFIRDDKKNNYWLITVRGNKRTDLKAFRKMFESRPLKFCDEAELKEKLGLYPGAVSPFGLLNNDDNDVVFVMDEDFFKDEQLIGCHPNDNTATVFLGSNDLKNLVEMSGNIVQVINIPTKE